ncbi:MAG: hypothetical protein IPM32_02330 [Ignavibacteriae bacterium]|nr:hypothetical protein [Ignavibacteriota bacterium]
MLKFNHVIIVLLFLNSALLSQEKLFQIELGLSQSWFNYELNVNNDFDAEFKPQLTFGINYQVYSLYGFSLTAGLRYHDLFRYLDMSPFGFAEGEFFTVDNYILSIPFQVKYNVDIINTNALLNIQPSYIFKSKIKFPSISEEMTSEEREITNEMNQIQFAIGLGLEYVVLISQEKFGIKSVYNFGLTSIPKNGEFTRDGGTYEWIDYNTSELNLLLTYYL